MSKRIKTLVMTLIIASITSTGAFAASNTVNTTPDERNEAIALQEDSFVRVSDGYGNPVRKTLTPVGDGTRLYESKLGTSTLSVNNVVGSGREDHKTMLWAKRPVTVNFSGAGGRYIFKSDNTTYRVSRGRFVFIIPQMEYTGYANGLRDRDYIKELPFQSDYQKDKSVTLAEPGLYRITDGPGEGGNECLLYIGSSAEDLSLVEPKIENAVATSLSVTAIDKTTSLPAYNINGESYIRAKDLAYILNKTTRQFDSTVNNIITYRGYAPNGSELKALTSGNSVATPYTETFMLNNRNAKPSIYTINNENFISLSDMKSFLNLNLSVNGNAVTVNDITKSDAIPTDSEGIIKVEELCLGGRYYENYERENYNIGYNTINMNGLTVEQIIAELKRFDAKVIRISGQVPDELKDYLKSNYEVKPMYDIGEAWYKYWGDSYNKKKLD